MNFKQLLNKYTELRDEEYSLNDDVIDDLLELKKELIPEVPIFVADWYEDNKDQLEYNIWYWFKHKSKENSEENIEFYQWLNNCTENTMETLIKMKIFGYSIKEEKKYRVMMKGLDKDESYLKYNIKHNFWYLGTSETYKNTRVKHTIKDIKDNGFEDVLTSPLFEIEEV